MSDISNLPEAFHVRIVLNKGRVMYEGAVADVPSYFVARNHPNPTNYNPADWIMVSQVESLYTLVSDFNVLTAFLPERGSVGGY
jgi:hypothetical protein